MEERFIGLLPQPSHNRDAAIAEHQNGMMRIAYDARQFLFEDVVVHVDDLLLVEVGHLNPLLA